MKGQARLKRGIPSLVWISLLPGVAPQSSTAQQAGPKTYAATPQRPTFTSDTSVTAPGSVELELGGTFSRGSWALPAFLKFTPDVAGLFSQTELGVGFDLVSSVSIAGNRETRLGDSLSFSVRRAVYEGGSFSVALAPLASFFLREKEGVRLGATGIAVYSWGLNSLVGNLTWTGATRPSTENPSGQVDVSFDYVRSLGSRCVWERLAIFAGALYENPTGHSVSVSLAQGMSYKLRPHWVLDLAVVERGLAFGPSEWEILGGATVNLGRPASW